MPKYLICLSLWMLSASAANAADDRNTVNDGITNSVVTNDFSHCVRTKWQGDKDACGAAVKPVAKPVPHVQIAVEERTVYFDFNKTTLNATEKQKLDALASILKNESSIHSASIIGYADRIGNKNYNEQLSKQRAKTVENYLHEQGYLKTSGVKTRWFGEEDSQTHCPNSLKRKELISCLQKDRRVEVELEYTAENIQKTLN